MKHILFYFIVLLSNQRLVAQWAIPQQMQAESVTARIAGSQLRNTDILYGMPLPPPSISGDSYIDKKWNISSILLYDKEKTIDGIWTRIDLESNQLEFKTNKGYRVLEITKIKSIVWEDSLLSNLRVFVNNKEIGFDLSSKIGVSEIIFQGDVSLVKQIRIIKKESNYNVALAAGNNEIKKIKRETFYFRTKDTLKRISTKNELIESFPAIGNELDKYMKTEKVSLKKESDLIKLFEHLNTVLK